MARPWELSKPTKEVATTEAQAEEAMVRGPPGEALVKEPTGAEVVMDKVPEEAATVREVTGETSPKNRTRETDLLHTAGTAGGVTKGSQSTKKESIMHINKFPQADRQELSYLEHIKKKLKVPNQTLMQKVKMNNNKVVLAEGWYTSDTVWLGAQLCRVENGLVEIKQKL